MKTTISLFILLNILMTNLYSETIDRSAKPEPLPASEFKFPEYSQHKLKNGLTVFVIEDNEQPTVSFSLLIPGGTSQDGDKAGTAELVAGLLTKGTSKRKALDIAQAIDGIGASIQANASGDFISVGASGLKKHLETILDVYADVISSPSFPDDEFKKLVPQMIAGLQHEKSQPTRIGGVLARQVIYGKEHPYSIKATEKSVSALKIKDIRDYYKKFFVPEHATLAVIGDVKAKDIVELLEKSFAQWKKGKAPAINIPAPRSMPQGVYFIHRPASEQSTVIVSSLGLPINHPEYEALDMTAKIIGSGFGGRLFRTLRETHSYTYSPWGFHTSSKFANRFACGADVNKDKTDSSLFVILEQLQSLGADGPTDDELSRQKRFVVGQYYLSFENSNFIASLIQQAHFNNIPLEVVKDYPRRITEMRPSSIAYSADKYMNPRRVHFVVVGDPSIRSVLEQFGPVFDYNLDLEPISGAAAKMDKVSMNVRDLIERHTKALGGREAINAIHSIRATGNNLMNIGGQPVNGEILQVKKAPNLMFMDVDMKMFRQTIWCDGKKVIAGGMGDPTEFGPEEAETILFEAVIFNTAKLLELGYEIEIKGKQAGNIVAIATSPKGKQTTYYFDENSYLITRYESIQAGQHGDELVTVRLSNWQTVGNVKLPGRIENITSIFTMTSEYQYELNIDTDEYQFSK